MDQIVTWTSGLTAWQVAPVVFAALVASGLGLFSEDAAVAGMGLAAQQGVLHPVLALGVCLGGVLAADSLLYILGQLALRDSWLTRKWSSAHSGRICQAARRHGGMSIFVIRFIPWLRAPLFFGSNRIGISYPRFILADSLAALLSIPLVMGLSMAGSNWVSG